MKLAVRITILIAIFCTTLTGVTFANITNTSVQVSPNATNHNTEIQVGFLYNRQNNAGQRLAAGVAQVNLSFPEGFVLPPNISASHITLNNINVIDPVVDQDSRTISFITPQNLHNANPAQIRIGILAGIRNPSSPASGQTIGILTRQDPSQGNTTTFTGTTPAFEIVQSQTTISASSVAPNPSVEFFPAEYTFGFTLGGGGYLRSNDRIFLTFPTGTNVPVGAISGVTINGTNAVAVGTGSRMVEVISPFDIANNASVQLRFRVASGIRNASAGSRVVLISTTSETQQVASDPYNLSPVDQLSFSAISTTNDTVNANTRYEIDFFTGSPGNLQANTDRIELTFPENTLIPATINPNLITIQNSEGFTDSPTALTRSGNTLIMTTPVSIGSNTSVRVTIRASAGFRNPSQPGNYTMSARTSRPDNTPINDITPSNPFSVIASDSRVTPASVTLSNSNANQSATYTVTFSTGKNGRLGSQNIIHITFPDNTNLGSATVTINGQSATVSASNQLLSIQVPGNVSISNNGQVQLQIANVVNPTVQGVKSLSISTTAEPTPRLSNNYAIGGTSISISGVNVNPLGANNVAGYNIWISTANNYRRNENDFIRIFFPNGTLLPESVNPSHVTINGGSGVSASQVITDTDAGIMDIYLTANNNSTFGMWGILISANAGIINPSVPNTGNANNITLVPDAYRLTITTSRQPAPAVSPVFNIQPNSGGNATFNSMTVSPNLGGFVGAAYTLRFTPTNLGRLAGGTSAGSNFVRLSFFGNVTIPASIQASDVTVNGVAASVIQRVSNTEIRIYIPEGVQLMPGQQAEIRIASSAGLTNGSAWNANTSQGFQMQFDHSYSPISGNFILSNVLNSSFDDISLSNDTKNAASGYTLRITPGTGDQITAGQNIQLTFPANTFVPSEINRIRIRMNGQEITQNAVLSGTRTILFPAPVSVGVGEEMVILISSNAGILNPTNPGTSYRLTATLPSGTLLESPSYTIITGSSTTTMANIDVSNPQPAAVSNYEIRFRTGEFGRLISGESTITIILPSGTNVANVTGTTINGESASFAVQGAQRTVTITVPANLEISNDSPVTLVVNGIINPPTASTEYKLTLRTSVDTQNITSNPYTITAAAPVTIIDFRLNNDIVNQDFFAEIDFQISSILVANTHSIHLQFLNDYGLPVQLAASEFELVTFDGDSRTLSNPVVNFNNSSIALNVAQADLNPGNYTLLVREGARIRNPREPGDNYSVRLWTSTQPVAVTAGSPQFRASDITSISNLTVRYTTNQHSQPTGWIWEFTTGSLGALRPGDGSVFLRFPANVAVPASVQRNEVFVNNARAQAVFVNTDVGNGRTELRIIIPASATIGANSDVRIEINPAAGIQFANPANMMSSSTYSPMDNAALNETLNNSYSAATSAEDFEEFGDDAVLPITLSLFQLRSLSMEGFPVLEWVTETEIENSGFRIERKMSESEWKDIAFVEGRGFSTERVSYTYTDYSVDVSGTYRYRLVQIDFDGTETMYGEVEFYMESPEHFALHQNYPNPFNPVTTIAFHVASQTNVSVIVYDVLGRQVSVLVNEVMPAGQYQLAFDASRLASGIYFARMVADGNVFTRKMMLVK